MITVIRRADDLFVGETRTLRFDWADEMADANDSVADSEWATDGGITAGDDTLSENVASVEVDADTAGEARAINTITTAAGMTMIGRLLVTVRA